MECLLWDDCLNRMELLALKFLLLERRPQDIEIAVKKFKEVRKKNKIVFDHKHRLRPQAIENRDWMLIYDSSWDDLHSITRKFAKKWFGTYVVKHVNNNVIFLLQKLNGTKLKLPIACKMIKLFRKKKLSWT